MNLILLFSLSAAYFLIRSKLWFPVVDAHAAAMAHPYREYGNNFSRYFSSLGSHLSIFIASTTFGRAKKIGQRVYDFVLTSIGIFLYIIAVTIFDSVPVALISTALLYFCSLCPNLFDSNIEPEAYAAFFTILGLTVVVLGLHHHLLPLIPLGTAVGMLGFLCKSSSTESLWLPIYIFLEVGISVEFWASTFTISLFLAATETAYSLFGSKKAPSSPEAKTAAAKPFRFLRLLSYILWDTARHYPDRNLKGILKTFCDPLFHHFSVIFPIIILFLIGILHSDLKDAHERVLFTWMLIGALPAFFRMQSCPLYYFISHLPLCIGAAFGAVHLFGSLSPEWYVALLLTAGTVIGIAMRSFKARSGRRSIQFVSDSILDIVNFLKNRVSAGTCIFQDSKFPQIYFESGCMGPDREFLIFHIQKLLIQSDGMKLKRLIRFFIEKKPKYYISFRKDYQPPYGHNLSLSCIEQITGLRYKLVYFNELIHVYELKAVSAPMESEHVDLETLFDGNYLRHAADRFHHAGSLADLRLPPHIASVVDYLKDKVTADDHIFQNSYNADIYYALTAQPPPRHFFRADRLDLSSAERLDQFLNFFMTAKPKYYIAMQPATINLSALERATGLRYEIEHLASCSIYRLAGSGFPADPIQPADSLLQFDTKRSRQDIAAFKQRLKEASRVRRFERRARTSLQIRGSDANFCNHSRQGRI